MFSRKKGLFIVTAMALLGVAFVVRIGQAQKSTPAKAPSAGHAQLTSKVAIVGRAVGFAETRPVRELMAEVEPGRSRTPGGKRRNERAEYGVRTASRTRMRLPRRTAHCNPPLDRTAASS